MQPAIDISDIGRHKHGVNLMLLFSEG